MKPLAVILISDRQPSECADLARSLKAHPAVSAVFSVRGDHSDDNGCIRTEYPHGGSSLKCALEKALSSPSILIVMSAHAVSLTADDVSLLLAESRKSDDSAIWYADYYETGRSPSCLRATIDYQLGSIRDDFNFGPCLLVSGPCLRDALSRYGELSDSRWGGLYELRLLLSCRGAVRRIPHPCSLVCQDAASVSSHFDYVDHARMEQQKEMELIATRHLQRIGALCSHAVVPAPEGEAGFPVEASIVIPVRNRERTITDALRSALTQEADFSYNVIVVENHSTDGTRREIEEIARKDSRTVVRVPERHDLGIGGCWNEAVGSSFCGRFVCQLDSDDLFAHRHALADMIEVLRGGMCGMAVGSYRVVDFALDEIPPGVVDHREWTDGNGRNNLLRVNGIGAPRAFSTTLLRQHPFPDVSYGEDYAAALRISRDYRVGRIYEPLYLCRRWSDNTDADLTPLQKNEMDFYKDTLRSQEIEERIACNRERNTSEC